MKWTSCVVLLVASALPFAASHGKMIVPEAEFVPGTAIITTFASTIEAASTNWPGKFDGDPTNNVAAFTAAFDNQKNAPGRWATLRAMIDSVVPGCGNTLLSVSPKPIPSDGKVQWTNTATEGFTPSHTGPCEIWLDDTRVLQNDNCAGAYTDIPAHLAVDFSSCVGSCTIRFYWLALHQPTWQAYSTTIHM
ncbi:Aste57867_25216 [Aphanomyces stellatus]|uniref:Aste57867_25216 protein n=1 Tax=Aphanomyces stellatus TaxID=120398 RepID=A0A485LSM4_9STRA|nr:hypothetical protein As57867_025138 [Aphanomyces stellatus]VFU01843.1 Aste57867_25216 [Aphanomyces stellatus]